jgi:hypothetical protein
LANQFVSQKKVAGTRRVPFARFDVPNETRQLLIRRSLLTKLTGGADNDAAGQKYRRQGSDRRLPRMRIHCDDAPRGQWWSVC